MADLSSDIAQQAVEPISSTADGQSSTGRSIADMIAADKYLAGKATARNRRRGMLLSVFRTPGAAGGGGPQNDFNRPCGGC